MIQRPLEALFPATCAQPVIELRRAHVDAERRQLPEAAAAPRLGEEHASTQTGSGRSTFRSARTFRSRITQAEPNVKSNQSHGNFDSPSRSIENGPAIPALALSP
jgi:hypothetical protein